MLRGMLLAQQGGIDATKAGNSRFPRRDISLLLLGNAISSSGDMAAYVALVLRLQGNGSSWVSALIAAEFLPPVVMGPLAGVLVDRFESRKVLLISLLGQAIVTLGLSFRLAAPATIVLVGLLACLSAFTRTGMRALVPNIAGSKGAARGYARLSTGTTIGWIIGPAVGGLLTGHIGSGPTILLDAFSFLVLWLFVLAISARRPPQHPEEAAKQVERRPRYRPFHLMARDSVLRVALPLSALAAGIAVVDNVAAPFRFVDQLRAGASGFGVYETVWAVGALAGVQLLAISRTMKRPDVLLAAGNMVMGAGIAGIGVATNFGLALVAAVIGGAGNGLSNASESAVIQSRSPADILGGVFGLNQGLVQVATALGTLVAAPSVKFLGAALTMISFGIVAAAASAVALTVAAVRK